MKTIALVNARSGSAGENARARVAKALASAGIDAKVELITGGDLCVRCKAIARRGDPMLIVGGGDGTIGSAASALVGTTTAIGILPLGTLNHFARDLGIPADLEEAARIIAARREQSVDVGEMNGRIFINNSAIGLYPLMVLDRDLQRRRSGRSKRLGMVVASLRTLARFGHQRLTLTVNDQKARVDTPLLFVGNNDYRIELPAVGQRRSIDGGELCVMVMRKKTRWGFIAAALRALFNRSRPDDMVRLDGVKQLRVESSHRQIAVSLDGEIVPAAPPLDYKVRNKALRVIAP